MCHFYKGDIQVPYWNVFSAVSIKGSLLLYYCITYITYITHIILILLTLLILLTAITICFSKTKLCIADLHIYYYYTVMKCYLTGALMCGWNTTVVSIIGLKLIGLGLENVVWTTHCFQEKNVLVLHCMTMEWFSLDAYQLKLMLLLYVLAFEHLGCYFFTVDIQVF